VSGVRCFVAISLPQPLVDGLLGACAQVRDADATWRQEKWVGERNLHLTLKFMGELDENSIAPLSEQLARVVASTETFELPFTGISAAGGLRRCRMLWATFSDQDGRCERLHARIEEVAGDFGVPTESRPFAPHVTLCRARRPKTISENALAAGEAALATTPDSMSVVQASLFSSRLTPRGPIYREIGTWRLRGE
jgi:2'-5' RNA ligase